MHLPGCGAQPFCSDPANCMNDGECDSFNEGCVCADCAEEQECLDNPGTGGNGGAAGAGGAAQGGAGGAAQGGAGGAQGGAGGQ